MSDGKTEEVQQGMEQYLKTTYAKEFVVEKPYLTGNEGEGYFYQAKAYPKGQPELEFFVEGDRLNSGVYIDGYLQVLWTYQGKQEVEAKIREVFGEETDFVLRYQFRYNNKEFKDLNHSEVLVQCNGKAYIDITFLIFSNTQIDKPNEAKKAYQILKTCLLDKNISKYDFNILYFTENFKQEYYTNPATDKYGKDLDELHNEGKLINFLKIYHLKDTHPIEIRNSDDLIKWFQY